MKLKAVQFQTDIAFCNNRIEKTIGDGKLAHYQINADENFVYVRLIRDPGMGREFAVPMSAVNWIERDPTQPAPQQPASKK